MDRQKRVMWDRVLLAALIVAGPNMLGAWLWLNFGIEIAATVILFLVSGLSCIVVADIRLSAKERKAKKRRRQFKYLEGSYKYAR